GEITVDAALAQSKQKEQVRRLRQQVGFVFQNFNLFPHRSVMEYIIDEPVIVQGEAEADAVARARTLLEKDGLHGKDERYPRGLSGGQRQREELARALARR
ncbi:MAG TPA: L-cystine ABC transporter ATP-binding protein YecC, partial [Pantoea agglomerans]|nr:L-cystine ABC transporter ATP-binding protein YecC [Pantoea agglomerans]